MAAARRDLQAQAQETMSPGLERNDMTDARIGSGRSISDGSIAPWPVWPLKSRAQRLIRCSLA